MAEKNNYPDIIFIGQPNCGKSTLFNALAGFKAEVSNFPGTTVEHSHSRVNVSGRIVNIIDLPGTYSLNPSDEAEKVALRHLFIERPSLIINVVDASILGRSLEMTLELIELEYPMIVALNMFDLAGKKGIEIEVEKLQEKLGVPVIPTIAPRGKGLKELMDKALECLGTCRRARTLEWSRDVEKAITKVEKELPEDFPVVANKRFTAIKAIEMEKLFFNRMLDVIDPGLNQAVQSSRKELEKGHNVPAYEVIAAERHHLAMKIFEQSSRVRRGVRRSPLEKIDDVIMHPFWGYFILLAVFVSFFFIIFKVAGPLEEWLLEPVQNLRGTLAHIFGGGLLFWAMDGLLQGVGGGVAIVLPYFIPLLFLMAFLEDIGYLSRVGFLMDTFMHKIGLHGKSVSPFILGFGCNVPAVVATRILESRRDRIVTALLIPFIPCSARTVIILALVAFYLGPFWALGFYFINLLLVGVMGRMLSFFFRTPSPGLILEIPSLKLPSLKNIYHKTLFQLRSFVRFAWPILIAGSMVLALMQYAGADRVVNWILSPLVKDLLGLPQELGVTLIFGFLRKELSLIMMLQALGVPYQNLMTVISHQQLLVFTVFVSFFIPCLSTVAIIWKEVGRKWALISMGLNTGTAVLLSLIIRAVMSLWYPGG
ncbi:MAG: ferrous iron transport protein B [Candidatus Aminicenantes bacterium]